MQHAPAINIQIVHIQGPLLGEIQEFSEAEISIGRLPECHVRFPKELIVVSRTHGIIVREGNRFKFIDQSTNGSFVNGKKIDQAYLQDGDVLMFSEGGPKVSFLTKTVEQTQGIQPVVEQKPVKEPEQATGIDTGSEPSAVRNPEEPAARLPESPPVAQTPPEPEQADQISEQRVKASLIIQYGPTIKSFNELPVTLGRHQTCDIIIDHPAILDKHAQFFFKQNTYRVQDLTGKNIISINEEPIGLQAALLPDAEIALSPSGPSFKFIGGGRLLEIEETAPKAQAGQETDDKDANLPEEHNKSGKSIFKKVLKSLDAIQRIGRS